MMTFVVVLNTQMWKIKLRSSIFIIKSDAQKQMLEFGFGYKFHDLNYFEIQIFFHILEFIIYLRASSQIFLENH